MSYPARLLRAGAGRRGDLLPAPSPEISATHTPVKRKLTGVVSVPPARVCSLARANSPACGPGLSSRSPAGASGRCDFPNRCGGTGCASPSAAAWKIADTRVGRDVKCKINTTPYAFHAVRSFGHALGTKSAVAGYTARPRVEGRRGARFRIPRVKETQTGRAASGKRTRSNWRQSGAPKTQKSVEHITQSRTKLSKVAWSGCRVKNAALKRPTLTTTIIRSRLMSSGFADRATCANTAPHSDRPALFPPQLFEAADSDGFSAPDKRGGTCKGRHFVTRHGLASNCRQYARAGLHLSPLSGGPSTSGAVPKTGLEAERHERRMGHPSAVNRHGRRAYSPEDATPKGADGSIPSAALTSSALTADPRRADPGNLLAGAVAARLRPYHWPVALRGGGHIAGVA